MLQFEINCEVKLINLGQATIIFFVDGSLKLRDSHCWVLSVWRHEMTLLGEYLPLSKIAYSNYFHKVRTCTCISGYHLKRFS